MTYAEAEERWQKELEYCQKELKLFENKDDGVARIMVSTALLKTTIKAFEAIRDYEIDLAREKELNYKNLVASVINYADDSEAEKAEATFDVDNYKVTITAERKEK